MPDTCQYLKDNVTIQKVSVLANISTNAFEEVEEDDISTETFLQSTHLPSNLIVAKSIVELHMIPLRLEGCISAKVVLDKRSQVIGLCCDIWERLGLLIYSD